MIDKYRGNRTIEEMVDKYEAKVESAEYALKSARENLEYWRMCLESGADQQAAGGVLNV